MSHCMTHPGRRQPSSLTDLAWLSQALFEPVDSICLRLDYGNARILLTGDLNKKSMEWIIDSYGDRIGAFNCDVVKACHHGSGDISFKFLEQVKAGRRAISSGDAEGFAHPRPEVVAASAVTGHVSVDRSKDKLITPLIYMTEVERSVALGQVTHIRFERLSGHHRQHAGWRVVRHAVTGDSR